MKPYFYILNADQNIICKRDNLESAKIAAESCALNYPGASYEILKCVGISSTSKPMTFWMDGESDEVEPEFHTSKYRELNPGEIIQEGDEFKSMFNGWIKARLIGNAVGIHPYRRPTSQEVEYRDLVVGEKINPETDQFLKLGVWMNYTEKPNCEFYGPPIHLPHRRPI